MGTIKGLLVSPNSLLHALKLGEGNTAKYLKLGELNLFKSKDMSSRQKGTYVKFFLFLCLGFSYLTRDYEGAIHHYLGGQMLIYATGTQHSYSTTTSAGWGQSKILHS